MATAADDRIRDADRTKAQILAAAQKIFSTHGYADAKVRDITAIADVNPSLVSRYFGSKLKLYEAALEAALNIRLLTDIPKANFGRDVVARFIGADENAVNPLPMLMFGAADSEAREVALRLLKKFTVEPLARWFGREGEARAAQIMALATGFFAYRLMLPLPAFEGAVDEAARRWLAEAFQAIVDAD